MIKIEILEFKNLCNNLLENNKSLSENSIRNRKSRFNILINDLCKEKSFNSISSLDIERALKKIKYKSDLSACINAIRFLKKNNINFDFPSDDILNKIIANKKKTKRKSKNERSLKDIDNKINKIRNEEFRIAYKLMRESGLRVHEVSALQKNDFEFYDDTINISLRKAKGNKLTSLTIQNKYLSKKLKSLISINKKDNLFPSTRLLQNKATEIGIQCHDLRRGFAKEIFEKQKKEKGYHEALEFTKEKLRHGKIGTTKIYVYSKIKV